MLGGMGPKYFGVAKPDFLANCGFVSCPKKAFSWNSESSEVAFYHSKTRALLIWPPRTTKTTENHSGKGHGFPTSQSFAFLACLFWGVEGHRVECENCTTDPETEKLMGNSYGPMVLKVILKFPPAQALVHGWLFPDWCQTDQTRHYEMNSLRIIYLVVWRDLGTPKSLGKQDLFEERRVNNVFWAQR